MTHTGFFSGSFDPMTNGHLDVIDHAAWLCDRLVIGVGSNPNKAGLFTVEERLALIREAAAPALEGKGCDFAVVSFAGLAIDAAREAGATLIVRGLRDFDRFRLRDADGRHEPGDGAGPQDHFPARLVAGAADHRDAGAPDRLDGRRRLPLRAAERGRGAEAQVRDGRRALAVFHHQGHEGPRSLGVSSCPWW